MQYTVKVYQKNARKWGKLNDMRDDISSTLDKRDAILTEMSGFMTKQMRKLISRRVTLESADFQGRSLIMKKEGFARGNGMISRPIPFDHILANFFKGNKPAFNEAVTKIRNKQKRQLFEIFVNSVGTYSPSDVRFTLPVNKSIMNEKFEKRRVASVSVEIAGRSVRMKFFESDSPSSYEDIEGNDFDYNLIKEQLYLPLWKLMVKTQRHANRELKRAEKAFVKLKKDSEPVWMAQKIAEISEPQVEE